MAKWSDQIFPITDDADPHRCQSVIYSQGQCRNKAIYVKDYDVWTANCPVHGGNKQAASIMDKAYKNYMLTKFRALLARHSSSDFIKSLRDEIGILRMLLEVQINSCNDSVELMLSSGPISDLVLKIEKVVSSCHKLEGSMGQLVDKAALLQFAHQVVSIISKHIEDSAVLSQIADEILDILKDEE